MRLVTRTSILVHRKCFTYRSICLPKWIVRLSPTISQTDDAIELRMMLLLLQLRRRRAVVTTIASTENIIFKNGGNYRWLKCARTNDIDRNELAIDNIRGAYLMHGEYKSFNACVCVRLCFYLVDNGNCMNSRRRRRRRHSLYRCWALLLTMDLISVLNSNLARKSKIKWQWLFECFLSLSLSLFSGRNAWKIKWRWKWWWVCMCTHLQNEDGKSKM